MFKITGSKYFIILRLLHTLTSYNKKTKNTMLLKNLK